MKLALIFIAVLLTLSSCATAPRKQKHLLDGLVIARSARPKILVITSDHGGGHLAAAAAVEESLGAHYEVVKLDLLKDKLGNLDEKFMDYIAKERWFTVYLMGKAQPLINLYVKKILYSSLKEKIAEQNPDLIVSVFNVGNKAYHEIAQELGIRSIVIPTDLYSDMFLYFFEKDSTPLKDQAIVCRAFDDSSDAKKLEEKGLLQSSVVTGYPIRPLFNRVAKLYRAGDRVFMKELAAIKEKMGIGSTDKVVIIAPLAPIRADEVQKSVVLDYIDFGIDELASILPESSNKLHFIVVTGKNSGLYESVKKKSLELAAKENGRVVIHPEKMLPPEHYAKLMALAHVPIIKPGGATLNEMIALGKRVLVNSDSASGLPWEKANLEFAVEKDWALALNKTIKGKVDKDDYVGKLKILLARSAEPLNSPANEFDMKFKILVDDLMFGERLPH